MFELRGGKTHQLASALLQPYIDQGPAATKGETGGDNGEDDDGRDDAFVASALEVGRLWSGCFRSLPSPATLPEGLVMALTVKDPREVPIALQSQGSRIQGQAQIDKGIQRRVELRKVIKKHPEVLAVSPLWMPEVSLAREVT